MDDYFKNVQASSQIPVFPLNGGDFESPMNVLVPPRMESLFLDHREGLGGTSPLPHALLVRDWPVAGALEYQSWWLDYFSEEEVEEAAKKRKADVDGRVPNQLEEHAELCSFAQLLGLSAFENAISVIVSSAVVPVSARLMCGCGSRFIKTHICFQLLVASSIWYALSNYCGIAMASSLT